MNLKDIYMECFTIEEIISLINSYSIIVNAMGDDVRFIPKLDYLMEALQEKIEENPSGWVEFKEERG